MEPTIGARIRQLREAKQLSVADFAKAAGVKPSAVYGLESGANKPSLETVAALRASFPGLNTEWLQFGDGSMFSRTITPATVPSEARAAGVVVEEPRLAYAAAPVEPALSVRLMEELADCQKQNRLDLARAQKDFREDLNASGRTWQYTVDRMKETSDGQAAEIVRLRAENGELRAYAGLDLPSVREVPAAPAAAPAPVPTSAPIGFGRPQPQGAEMHAVPGGLYDASFHRLPTAEAEPYPLRLAA